MEAQRFHDLVAVRFAELEGKSRGLSRARYLACATIDDPTWEAPKAKPSEQRESHAQTRHPRVSAEEHPIGIVFALPNAAPGAERMLREDITTDVERLLNQIDAARGRPHDAVHR